ncbi:MAG: hypothetical protein KDC44_06045 [Phaeodactylibacter sp.]|nr:hypothetical protein [Phaeodactylibacter sp.]
MEDYQHIDAIEDYLEQRMSVSEREAFEQKLATDRALKGEFDTYRAALKVLEFKTLESPPLVRQKRLPLIPMWGRIAAIGLLLIAVVLWSLVQFNYSDEAIATSRYQEPLFTTSLRGEGAADQYQLALADYQEAQYEAAITKLQGLTADEAQYLEAHCFFHLNQSEQAIARFSALANNPDSPRSESAEWYLALSYLQSGNAATAINLLKAMAGHAGHANQQKAADLLQVLKSPWRKIVF